MNAFYEAVIFLAAAVLVVPLSKRLGFGAVLGYLVAGVVIGPFGTGLIADVEAILGFSEIGVVLLLFVIGLELQPARLRVLRKSVFGFGTLQVLVTGAALTLGAVGSLHGPSESFVIGFGLSLSSTAFVLQMLAERKQLTHAHGRAAFGILLLQDLAIVPLVAIVGFLAGTGQAGGGASSGWLGLLRSLLVLAVFVVAGRLLLRPILRLVASVQVQEIFTATALLLVIGSALLLESLGLSMGLGAFLAGVLVADSEYRHQLETDIEPFKGLLLGLFFMAVGMSVNLGLLVEAPGAILGTTLAFMALKAVVLFVLARLLGLATRAAAALAVVLSQGGEFAFVLFNLAGAGGMLAADLVERLVLIVTLSMAATPVLYFLYERAAARVAPPEPPRPFDTVEEGDHKVVIAGFGRFGQIVARILNMSSIRFTALEKNPSQVDFVKRFGNEIYYGDATRLDLLRSAHVDRAKIFVLAVDDVEESVEIAETVRRHFPDVALYARARNRRHALRLMSLGAKAVIRDTLLSSVALSGDVLKGLGLGAAAAARATELFARHDRELLEKQFAIRDDEEALVQSSKDAAKQLRELFELDAGEESATRRSGQDGS